LQQVEQTDFVVFCGVGDGGVVGHAGCACLSDLKAPTYGVKGWRGWCAFCRSVALAPTHILQVFKVIFLIQGIFEST
jgi:hypothetical protein